MQVFETLKKEGLVRDNTKQNESPTFHNTHLVRFPNSLGILDFRLLPSARRVTKFLNFPRDDGKDPAMKLLSSRSSTN